MKMITHTVRLSEEHLKILEHYKLKYGRSHAQIIREAILKMKEEK